MIEKISQEEKNLIFLKKLKNTNCYNDNYDYSLVEYKGARTKILIIHKKYNTKHLISPTTLRKDCCNMRTVIDENKNKLIVQKFKEIHGDKYDYSLVDYINTYSKIKIICPDHGIFEQSPRVHIMASGCQPCGINNYAKDYFIKNANKRHNNKYDYSLVDYKSSKVKVKIICPDHDMFENSPNHHLRGGRCQKCRKEEDMKILYDDFIEKSNIKHNNKYDYSLVDYKGSLKKVNIVCPEHGIFKKLPPKHKTGSGCPKCSRKNTIFKYDKDDYIAKANKKHNNKYDYSLVDYKGSKENVKIICPEHGIFEKSASSHIIGYGCNKCSGYFLTIEKFIEKSNIKHNNKYDYSLIKKISGEKLIKIICPEHGIFNQAPSDHMNGRACAGCKNNKKKDNSSFVEKSIIIHNNKYDYSLVEYKNNSTKVKIICPEHGMFSQHPQRHLGGSGCLECSIGYTRLKNSSTLDFFLEKANKRHNNKYDYSLVEYKNSSTKVKIICPEHGEFEQTSGSHLSGVGCGLCNGGLRMTKNEFVKRCKKRHHNKYDYSLVEYKNSSTKVKIICPEHGMFLMTPSNHISHHQGCIMCSKKESRGEMKIKTYLLEKNVLFEKEKWFDGCVDKGKLYFDFYIPGINTCVEYDGKQHFESVKFFGGDVGFENRKRRDNIKTKFCMDNNIKLIRIPYYEYDNIEKILDSI